MRTRPRCIGLWLNDAEHEHLMRQCAATGLNANAYIRKRIMGENLRPRPPDTYAALLRELPEHVGDPTSIWALYYLKKDQPEEALKLIQKQLYKLVNQTQTCLVSLMNPKLMSRPGQLLQLCQAHRAVSQTFGLADMSDAPMMEAYLQMGEFQQAADCFARYVDIALGPVTFPDEELFSPGLTYKKQEGFQATTQPLRRLLLQSITTEEKYRPLFEYPVFTQALEKLKASV